MAINVTCYPVYGEAILYFQDGTSQVLEAAQEHSFQIIDGGFCTISDAPADEDVTGEKFAEMMVKFWQGLWDKIRSEITDNPEVNPL